MSLSGGDWERRLDSRMKVGCSAECHLEEGHGESLPAMLDNISQTGALVWLGRDLPVGTRFELLLEPECGDAEPGSEPLTMLLEVLRVVGKHDELGRVGYGCIILETSLEAIAADIFSSPGPIEAQLKGPLLT